MGCRYGSRLLIGGPRKRRCGFPANRFQPENGEPPKQAQLNPRPTLGLMKYALNVRKGCQTQAEPRFRRSSRGHRGPLFDWRLMSSTCFSLVPITYQCRLFVLEGCSFVCSGFFFFFFFFFRIRCFLVGDPVSLPSVKTYLRVLRMVKSTSSLNDHATGKSPDWQTSQSGHGVFRSNGTPDNQEKYS